ncbi:tripartite tricarboxylate transporter substrate-binding protein [Devosia sp. 1566]|uniref:Bug family tripartite tricarboxylate transporter substrate binding protein n=1 Tax=Devosia sp. 1566 TaxID=2499144 RepID=UPI000FDCAC41|nr:tripartite tricarboxylate transporter substrate-binding protein [Devosia sp. 1566]
MKRLFVAMLTAGALALSASPVFAQLERLEIIAPAGAGGGYDQNARITQSIFQQYELATRIQVENQPGAGGTIGLANYVNGNKRNPSILMIGLSLVGAVLTNKSQVTLDDTYPLAMLSGEYQPIVVKADSPFKTLDDLIAQFKADPGSISWGGSGPGGSDHLMYGLLAKAAGMDPKQINYIVLTSGGEMLSGVMGGHVTVGTGGYSELASQIESGELRALAIGAPEPIEGIDIPTFVEQGYDVQLVNWRAVVSNKDPRGEERAALEAAVAKMVTTPEWQAALDQRGWQDIYMPPEEFAEFLKTEEARVELLFKELGLL